MQSEESKIDRVPRSWIVFVGLLSVLLSNGAESAEVSLSVAVNRDTLAWGDPVTYRVRVQRHPTDQVELLPGAFPGPFEVREHREPVVTEMEDGRIQEVWDYVLKAFEAGELEIPAITARIRTAEGDTGSISSRALKVVVTDLSVGEGFAEYDGPQQSVPVVIPLWVWVASVGLLVLLIVAFLKLRGREEAKSTAETPPPVDWREEVSRVMAMGLVELGDYKRHYSLLSEILRRFLEDEVGVEAMERTTGELRRDLSDAAVAGGTVRELTGFLSEADLVKFAKVNPGLEVASATGERVRSLMDTLEPVRPPAAENGLPPQEEPEGPNPAGNREADA